MSAESDEVYGFNRSDTASLLAIIQSAGGETLAASGPKRRGAMLFKTKAGGISANSSAAALWREPTATGWQDTTVEYTLWNQHPTAAVAASKIVVAEWINGRLVVISVMC